MRDRKPVRNDRQPESGADCSSIEKTGQREGFTRDANAGCASHNTAQNVLNRSGHSDFAAHQTAANRSVYCPTFPTAATDANPTFFRRLRLPEHGSSIRGVARLIPLAPFLCQGLLGRGMGPEECWAASHSFDFESPVLEDFGALLSDFALESDFELESGFDEAASDADLSAFAASLYDLLR